MISSDNDKLLQNRNSLVQAYLILIPLFNIILGVLKWEHAMITNIVICCLIILFARKSYYRGYKASFIFYVLLIIVYYCFPVKSRLETTEFIFYFVLATFIGTGSYNCEKTLRYVTYASLLVIPFWSDLFLVKSILYKNADVSMSVAYALFPMVVAGALHFTYFKNKSNILLKLCYILDIAILFQMLLKANRGLVVAVFVMIALVYIKGKSKDTIISNARIFRAIIAFVLVLFIVMNIDTVLTFFSDLLNKLGYTANFLEKTKRLSSDITNGREDIYRYTIDSILKSPVWGYGIDTIYYNSNRTIEYSHNFILQLLYDGGIILFTVIMIPLCKLIKDMFNKIDWERSIYSLFLFLICVPKMLFTSNLWSNAAFFMMLAYAQMYINKKDKQI